ncbi:MAG: cation diffusion facilitator family transporter [Candidatus Anstonellaceae archaeon]
MRNLRTISVVFVANVFLILIKAAVLALTGSIAVFAVLVDSLFDLLGNAFAYIGIRQANAPADVDHHFGHGKYDALASIAQLALIAAAASWILIEAIKRLIEGKVLAVGAVEILLALITVIVDIVFVWYIKKTASKTPAISAFLGNYTSDIAQNSLVLFGLVASMWGVYWLDPLVAVVVALFMYRLVVEVGKETIAELTDQSPPLAQLEKYGREIMKVKGVRSFHKMRARSASGKIQLDVHIQLSPRMNIKKAHEVCRKVKARLRKSFPSISEVLIHAEPDDRWQRDGPKFGS